MSMPWSERRGVVTDAVAKDWKWAAEHHKERGTWPTHAVLSLLAQREELLEALERLANAPRSARSDAR
jgi:hypothetical protein